MNKDIEEKQNINLNNKKYNTKNSYEHTEEIMNSKVMNINEIDKELVNKTKSCDKIK